MRVFFSSLVVARGLCSLRHTGSLFEACRLSSCGTQAQLPCGMWDLSSPTRDRTCVPCLGRQILYHWTTREVPYTYFWSVDANRIFCNLHFLFWVLAFVGHKNLPWSMKIYLKNFAGWKAFRRIPDGRWESWNRISVIWTAFSPQAHLNLIFLSPSPPPSSGDLETGLVFSYYNMESNSKGFRIIPGFESKFHHLLALCSF